MVVRLGRGQFYPQALAWTHGTIAVVGVGLLAYVVLAGAVDPLLDDGALFVVMAASGGAVLAVTGRGGQRPIGVLVFLHALFALFGLVLLAVALVRLVSGGPLVPH
jgi:hypothetical protein